MKQLGAYGNVTKTNLLINEFIKGRNRNLSEEERLIVNEVKDQINMTNGNSFVKQSRQKCENLFMSISFRGSRIVWNEDNENGPIYYPTDFGSCCLLVPHFLKPYDDNLSGGELYHGLKADALNGETNGVDIVLDAEQFNYAYYYSNSAGFKISMHNHLDKPMIQFSSQLINPGRETQINLKPIISSTTTNAIDTFSPDDRNCYADGEANLTYLAYNLGYRYEMNNCLVDQGIRDIMWSCRCIPSFYNNNEEYYLPFIPRCSGEKLHCANTRMKSLGMGFPIAKENDTIMPEAEDSPNKIGNISKPAHIGCMPACEVQNNKNQMSYAPYPQLRNFFYQKTFCEVASHIWQKTCQDENRAYFMDQDQPLLCSLLNQFDEFFGNKRIDHNVVSHIFIAIYTCKCR